MALPIGLLLGGRRALVVGRGAEASRRAARLAEEGALLERIDDAAEVTDARCAGARLVLLCDPAERPLLEAAAAAARRAGALVWAHDRPDLSDLHLLAEVRRGPALVAIGTGGRAPALAAALRAQLERLLDDDLGAFAEWLATERERLAREEPDAAARAARLRALVEGLELEGALRYPPGFRSRR